MAAGASIMACALQQPGLARPRTELQLQWSVLQVHALHVHLQEWDRKAFPILGMAVVARVRVLLSRRAYMQKNRKQLLLPTQLGLTHY